MASYWLKYVGTSREPCWDDYAFRRPRFVDFSATREPVNIHVGDRLVFYACGRGGIIFAEAKVTSEVYRGTWPPNEPNGREWGKRFPHCMDITYTVRLPVGSGVQIGRINTRRRGGLGNSIRGGSYLRLSSEEYRLAVERLREAARSHG